jgi:hypothetical protein
MAGLGQGVARIFVRFRPLSAYRLDILGSIAGIALFSLMSFLDQPPLTWALIAGVAWRSCSGPSSGSGSSRPSAR